MVNIKILDSGLDKYTLDKDEIVLGRRYDNRAETLQITIPETEQNSICTMIVTRNGQFVDFINVKGGEVVITSNLSQYSSVKFGFSFLREDGSIKNSEIAIGVFLNAQKPEGFVPVDPEQKQAILNLISNGFTNAMLNGNTLSFYNMGNQVVTEFDLSPFTQAQANLEETDSTKETFVLGKKTSNLVNDGSDGLSPYITEDFINDIITGLATTEYVDNLVGDINSILDNLNGEVI